ncbi:hypothetical protein GS538_09210 [Rhodococcus hoagii]|nr:hypothetical protein [Prescottella equi]
MTTTPAFPAGIVTETVATISGAQEGTIDVHNAQTPCATMTIRWGHIAMTFTSAEQVQHVLGYFAMARQGMLGVLNTVPLPVAPDHPHQVATLIAVTWTRNPDGVAYRDTMHIPAMRRTITFVSLKLGPVRFQILDRTGIDSAIELLTRAHKTAITAFVDGQDYRQNPTRPSWRPRAARLVTKGTDWPPRR